MHDEVSDTENIRKNLAIERMIVEGCDILLDTSQTFVRQGQLFSHIHTLIYKQSHTQRNKCIQQTAKKIIILSLCPLLRQALLSSCHPAVNEACSVRCA